MHLCRLLKLGLNSLSALTRVHQILSIAFASVLICVSLTLSGCLQSVPVRSSPSNPSRIENSSTEESRAEKAVRLFEILDVNDDGQVSRQEAKSGFRYLIAGSDSKMDAGALALGKSARNQKNRAKNSGSPPSQADADRALEALFVDSSSDSISRSDFEKIVVASRSASAIDPFSPFLN